MIELVLIAALSWFGYSQHERAVDAEALVQSCNSDVIGLNNMVIHWENRSNELEEGQLRFEDRIKYLTLENAKQKYDLELLSKSGGRDADYINTPIPDGVWEWVREGSNKD